MDIKSNNTTYTGKSSKGRVIDVFFFRTKDSEIIRALAISDHLTSIFQRKKDGTWYTHTEVLTLDWGPVVEAAYNFLLDDIISGDINNP